MKKRRGVFHPEHQNRYCWWCPTRIGDVRSEWIEDRDGNKVLVHGFCANAAIASTNPATAKPREWPKSPAVKG